jgi:ATP-binding cassette subfamily G (WHITE) protein 2 (SNQ2)
LRQDKNLSREEKLAYVDAVLDVLELTDIQDAIVGTWNAGLGLEQRKRLTIAVELVSRPSILFLDEPTRFAPDIFVCAEYWVLMFRDSGLDSQSAYQIVGFMRRLARSGLAVLATIHQPVRLFFFAVSTKLYVC